MKERGLTQDWGELWVERMVQLLKSTTKYRTHSNPEALIANDCLLRIALGGMQLKMAAGGEELATYEQLKAAGASGTDSDTEGSKDVDASIASGRLLDAGEMLHCDGAEWADLSEKLLTCIQNNPDSVPDHEQWVAEWEDVTAWKHDRAMLPKTESLVTSASYGRSQTRDGSYVVQYYVSGDPDDPDDPEEWKPYVGQVTSFIRVHHETKVLRFALCNFFKYLKPFAYDDIGEVFKAKVVPDDEAATYDSLQYPVLLNLISAPLCMSATIQDDTQWRFFVPIRFQSGKRRLGARGL